MQRIKYFDLLNVISCISVVALHCNGYVHSYTMDAEWYSALLFEVIFYFAVPVFVMLSGATLFDYRERYSTRTFFIKRIQRTVFPWFVWSIFWGCIYLIIAPYLGKHINFSLSACITILLKGEIPLTTYWFFIPLFMLYLFLPYLSKIVTHSSCKQILSLCGIIIFFQSVVFPIFNLLNIDYQFTLPIGGNFALYAIIGYCISQHSLEENKRFFYVIIFLAIFSLIARYIGICYVGERNSLLFTYSGLFAILPAISVFMICKKIDKYISNQIYNIIRELSKLSLGVYLIHAAIIHAFSIPFGYSSAIVRYAGIPIVYIASITIVYLLRKIPLVKTIVP